jgi:hypothetical protein
MFRRCNVIVRLALEIILIIILFGGRQCQQRLVCMPGLSLGGNFAVVFGWAA